MQWKVRPVDLFARNMTKWIGVDKGEEHRAEKMHSCNVEFPLLDLGLDRNNCIKVIKRAGLEVPLKSGCFICPYQSRKDWIRLREQHSDLYSIASELESQARVTFVRGVTLDEYTEGAERQMSLKMFF